MPTAVDEQNEATPLLTAEGEARRSSDPPVKGWGVETPFNKHGRPFYRHPSAPHFRSKSIGRSLSTVRDLDRTPPKPSADAKRRAWLATLGILCAVMLERCTFFSIVGNLVLFCTNELELTSTVAVTISLVFTGVAYMVPLVAGRIADTIAGRFNTLYGSFLVYFIGAALLPAVAFGYSQTFGRDSLGAMYGLSVEWKRGYFVAGIVLVAVGAGGIKANVSPFGAQQIEPLGQEAIHSFFNWFYWFVNIGGCIAYLGVVYVQQEIGFFLGYLIPATTLTGGLLLFLLPSKLYSIYPCSSVVGFIAALLWEGTFGQGTTSCRCCLDPPSPSADEQSPPSCNSTPDAFTSPPLSKPIRWLDAAKVSCGGSFADVEVDRMKCLIRTIPIFMTLILFSTFVSQNTTTMLLQGVRMNPQIGDFVIPAATLNIFKMIIIVLLLPLLDRIVYPTMHRFNRRPTLLQRMGAYMGFGMLAGVASLLCMGCLELARKADIESNGGRVIHIGGAQYRASNLSILWQVPQFLLTGLAETFTLCTAMEFSYTESPIETQGVMMGMNHLTTGLGNLIGSAIYICVATLTAHAGNPWLPNDINGGYLEAFVFLLAAILLLNFVVFLLLARWYQYSHLGDVITRSDGLSDSNVTPIQRRLSVNVF